MENTRKLRKWFNDISRILVADKLPYLFTILTAIIAYQLDHFISNISETPIIEYKFLTLDTKDSAGVKVDSIKVTIKNLNKKIAFKNLAFEIKYSSHEILKPNDVYDAELIPVAPASILPDSDAISWRSKFNRYKIPILQPGGEYWAMLKLRRNVAIVNTPLIYLNSSDNVWLTSSNIETFIVKNQICINIILIFLSFIMIVLYANHINNTQMNRINEN